jgi:hypothetical protein
MLSKHYFVRRIVVTQKSVVRFKVLTYAIKSIGYLNLIIPSKKVSNRIPIYPVMGSENNVFPANRWAI